MQVKRGGVLNDAVQWLYVGDHPKVTAFSETSRAQAICKKCGCYMGGHGEIDQLNVVRNVCPSDVIITDENDVSWPCKVDVYLRNYAGV